MWKNKKRWIFGQFEITRREILASISIVALLLLIGGLISSKISDYCMNQNEEYNKAVKIHDTDLFQYGMDTNIGNAFVYGDLKAIDTVTYPEIGGKYMYVKKIKEKYTMHTRQVAHHNGKSTYYTTETYWTWDYAGEESKTCKQINFCGITFKSKKISFPNPDYIDTIKESRHVRYKFYGTKTKYSGTIFTVLKDGTINGKTKFYNGKNIEQTVECIELGTGAMVFIFWMFWILLTVLAVYGFFYLDNEWLE